MTLRLLDLFCKAGGASAGYAQAGFDVTGVDIETQPRYPFRFVQGDALEYVEAHGHEYDVIAASPPCQGYSVMRHAPGAVGAPLLISKTRDALVRTGRPYAIENVEGAREHMRAPVVLCGSMFGLGAQGCWTQRHRLFEASIPISAPSCDHHDAPVIGVYGGHARKRSARFGGRGTQDAWVGGHKAAASEALGIDWMTLEEMSEAVPPAYTRWIGIELMKSMQERCSDGNADQSVVLDRTCNRLVDVPSAVFGLMTDHDWRTAQHDLIRHAARCLTCRAEDPCAERERLHDALSSVSRTDNEKAATVVEP